MIFGGGCFGKQIVHQGQQVFKPQMFLLYNFYPAVFTKETTASNSEERFFSTLFMLIAPHTTWPYQNCNQRHVDYHTTFLLKHFSVTYTHPKHVDTQNLVVKIYYPKKTPRVLKLTLSISLPLCMPWIFWGWVGKEPRDLRGMPLKKPKVLSIRFWTTIVGPIFGVWSQRFTVGKKLD